MNEQKKKIPKEQHRNQVKRVYIEMKNKFIIIKIHV